MIEVNDVHFTYPNGFKALNGVSMRIDDGEFVAIMGENGAGKSTLIKHFNGILKPTKGKVLIDGIDTTKSSVAELSRKVGIVFQNPDHELFCEMLEDEMSFALHNFGFSEEEIRKRVSWALATFDLEKYRDSSPFTLSVGEKKRLTIALTLAWDPDIIVFDEPTTGQDYRWKKTIRKTIFELLKRGKAVIIVTHDIEFVAECNPRVILLSKGKLIADGPAGDVLSNPSYVERASLVLPQVTKVLLKITELGISVPTNVIDVRKARDVISKIVHGDRDKLL